MPPAMPYSIDHSAETYVRGDSQGFVLCNPVRDFVIQGLLVTFLMPVLFVCLGILALIMAGPMAEQTAVLALIGGGVAVCAAASVLVGLVTVLTARRRSLRSEVLLDLRAHQIITPRGESVDWSSVSAVVVHKPNPLLKWWGVSLERPDARPVLLLGRLPPSRGPAIAALGRFVAIHLGVEPEIPARLESPTSLGLAPTTAGVLCYLPIQGIFLLASPIFLVTSKDPFVRFCAIQSLLQLALAMVLLVPVLACGGVMSALEHVVPMWVTVVVLGSVLVVFQAWRVIARGYACYQAYKGRAWVMPWLAFVVRRWLPPPPDVD